MDNEYYPEDLKIVMYFYEMHNYNVSFNIFFYDKSVTEIFSYNASYDNLDYITKKIELDTSCFSATTNYMGSVNIKIDKSDIKNYKWEESYVFYKEDAYIYNEIPDFKVYSYDDILFKYYRVDKNYLKGYYLDMPDYIKDEEDFVIRYKYKEKDKEQTQIVCPVCLDDCDVESSNNSKTYIYNVEEKNIDANKIVKFRHVIMLIIILVLSIMVYTVYSLRKD